MVLFRYTRIFIELLKTDLFLLRKTIINKFINSCIWVSTVVAVTNYLMPYFGLSQTYGTFMAIGTVVSCSGFEVYPQLANFVADLEGNKTITYYLTIPIPNWLLLVERACFSAINSFLISTFGFLTCKLVLGSGLDLGVIHYPKLLLSCIIISFLFGFFALWLVTFTKDMMNLENAFMRIVYPMWFLGGFQFTWAVLYSFSPTIALINLLNPYTYAMEGMRAAALGQTGYLPFGYCMLALVEFVIIFAWWSIIRLKKRLDFI